jgi:hypothetical protein
MTVSTETFLTPDWAAVPDTPRRACACKGTPSTAAQVIFLPPLYMLLVVLYTNQTGAGT